MTTTTNNENIIKFALYLGAPFFGYPHKPLLNVIVGSSYERAYGHFRRDHASDLNVGLHAACLVLQLTYNFGLLADMDYKIKSTIGLGGDLIATTTLLSWSASLISQSNAPPIVKFASCLSLWTAYKSRHTIHQHWKLLTWIQSILEVIAIHVFFLKSGVGTDASQLAEKNIVHINPLSFFTILAVRLFIQRLLQGWGGGSSLMGKTIVNSLIGLFMIKTCQDPWGKIPPFILGLVGWVFAIATNQPWLFFYSGGWMGSLMQGVAHHYSQEQATMPSLASMSDEMAHATFFPNLLFQSAYQSFQISSN